MILFPSERQEENWFFKYKIYHIPFWALYHFLWGVAEFSLLEVLGMIFYSPRVVMFLCYVFIHTFAVYFNLYFLFPRFLEKGKLLSYISWLSVWTVLSAIFLVGSYFLTAYMLNKDLDYFCGFEATNSNTFRFFLLQALPSTAGAMLLGMSIKLAKNWSQAQKRQQKLEKEKLDTELKFLKYQFNPHFLFNTINSIFFLIHKDPKMASSALAEFSELLRYQLYECNDRQISLQQEVSYLKNFVSLEKLRKNENFRLDLHVDPLPNTPLGIAPFILMTFVENAFKHVSKYQKKTNWVRISLTIEDERLNFEVQNSKSEEDAQEQEAIRYGGIGLKNVSRRLDLIYPAKHQLHIEDLENTFKIHLNLELQALDFPGQNNAQEKINHHTQLYD